MLKSITTRFRAFQLGNAGSSFSYFADNHFTLIEARLSDVNRATVSDELTRCGKTHVDTLHITSWDSDHCSCSDLETILAQLSPKKIEYPGYDPHCDHAEDCLKLIQRYQTKAKNESRSVICQKVDPPYINGLDTAEGLGYKDVFYHPKNIHATNYNDNSTVKLFRKGSFNVASLGDVESGDISALLKRCKIFYNETDVMILAHHGADNGFTTNGFLKKVKPTLTICSSNYDNQHDHPKQEIRDLLYEHDIPIFTTKTGDVIVESIGNHTKRYRVTNLVAGSTRISLQKEFTSKKSDYLQHNADSIRNRAHPGFRGLK